MLKLFHTADVHLDAPFSLSDPIEAEKRRTGLRSAFCSMIHAAKRMEADIFLICGDLFESSFVTKDTAAQVVREMESFPTCRFFITPGNHDPYDESSPYALLSFPKNVFVFTAETPAYVDTPEKNARVYGHAYVKKDIPDGLFSGFHVEDESKINILAAHGFVDAPQSTCNVLMKRDIEQSGLDYIALGHVHTHDGFLKSGKTVYAYSGCPVGRGFDECGYKGAIVGSISKENGETDCRLSTVKTCDKRFEKINVDLSGAKTADESLRRILSEAEGYGEDTALRITADGAISPDAVLNGDEVRRALRAPFYLEWFDNSVPILDTERLKNDPTILGAYYRQLESKLLSDDPAVRKTASMALRYGLAALCGRELSAK